MQYRHQLQPTVGRSGALSHAETQRRNTVGELLTNLSISAIGAIRKLN